MSCGNPRTNTPHSSTGWMNRITSASSSAAAAAAAAEAEAEADAAGEAAGEGEEGDGEDGEDVECTGAAEAAAERLATVRAAMFCCVVVVEALGECVGVVCVLVVILTEK